MCKYPIDADTIRSFTPVRYNHYLHFPRQNISHLDPHIRIKMVLKYSQYCKSMLKSNILKFIRVKQNLDSNCI